MIYKYFFFLSKTFPNIEGVKDIYDSIFIIHVVSDLVTICTCGSVAAGRLCPVSAPSIIKETLLSWYPTLVQGVGGYEVVMAPFLEPMYNSDLLQTLAIWNVACPACSLQVPLNSAVRENNINLSYQQNDEKVSKTPDRFLIDSFNLEI